MICKAVQYMSNRVIHSTETNIIFKMTVFCDEEATNTFQVPHEVTESHKYNTSVCTMTVFLQSDKCNI